MPARDAVGRAGWVGSNARDPATCRLPPVWSLNYGVGARRHRGVRKAPSNAERGTKFEQLMVRYFELDPTMAQQYDAVWRWIDWPERRGRTDTGIDLVARERDTGNYTAIQCKFYEPTHTLAKGTSTRFSPRRARRASPTG